MTTAKQRNERLSDAMRRAGLSKAALAAKARVDPRTVDRLVADASRVPHPDNRHVMAEALHMPVGHLWPEAHNGTSVTGEILAVYPSRAAIPGGLVMELLSEAQERVDVLALAAVWLWDSVPDFGRTLAAKADSGLAVRVCLGDPNGASVGLRGREEGIEELLGSRARLSLNYAQRHLGADRGAIALHDTTLYASILRFDDEVLVNWHLYGLPAGEAPLLHLRRESTCGLAETVLSSFERVWGLAQPLVG